jgi:Domain of unknown function (DUF3291)
MLINMSVWQDIKALNDYVYRSAHVELMRRRKESERMVRRSCCCGGFSREAPFEDERPAV